MALAHSLITQLQYSKIDTMASLSTSAPPLAPANVAPVIEPETDDHDSTFGSEGGSSFNYGSVTSSIYNFRQENGRTYHAYSDGKYVIPNDEREQDRMDMAYQAFQLLFEGKQFFAPVKNPQRIVDMGTGTGIWAIDTGDKHPAAHVIGIDLSPIQPKWTAPNVEFRIDDFDKPWVFDSPIDLVHSRICAGIAIQNWPNYLAEAYKCLRPGGWVEAQDFVLRPYSDDDSLPAESKIAQWHALSHEGLMVAGRNVWETSTEISSYFKDAGFVNVTVEEFKLPLGPWPKEKRLKEAGGFMMLSTLDDIEGISMALFTRLLGWEKTDVEVFLAGVKKEWLQKSIHAYWPVYAVYGQKPEEEKDEPEVEIEKGPAASDA